MVFTYPCNKTLLLKPVLVLLFLVMQVSLYAQLPAKDSIIKRAGHTLQSRINRVIADSIPIPKKDSLRISIPQLSKDSIRSIADSTFSNIRSLAALQKQKITSDITGRITAIRNAWRLPPKDSLRVDLHNPFSKMLITRPALRVHGGYIGYQFNYRSFIDTPFAEKDVLQHQVTGRLHLTAAGQFPLQVNYWLRQSNSRFFRNTADVQVSFSGTEFRNNLQGNLRKRLLALTPAIKDSLLEKTYALKQLDLSGLENELKTKFSTQKLIEANEVLKVPKFTWNNKLPDSVNISREDSSRKIAAFFLDQYAQTKKRYDSLGRQVDSLKKLYGDNLQKLNRYRQMVNGKWDELQSARQWKSKLEEYGMNDVAMPAKYRWLLGIRQFSIGRSPVNYSELTAKNISVNGINFEYNSWYYLAVTAGLVNYQFRDFAVNRNNRRPQYLYMLRAGIGRLEKNYFILSAFRGQKQLFSNNATGPSTIGITGLSAESRWALNRTTYLTAEIGKSITPSYRTAPVDNNAKLDLNDKNNQALAFHLYSYVPLTQSRIEGFYKKAGANYQSFSSYTTNAAMETWYIKAEQNLFKRKLRVAGALRRNEFSNPFIVQDYTSNTIFKSITASLRMHKLPVITVGYQPLSQYTKVNEQVIESRFQALNATAYHGYAVKQLRMATTAMLSKFYNRNTDTAFIYYNATNGYLAQHFFFSSFTAQIGASYTKNADYSWQVLDGSIQPSISKLGTVTLGIKINNLNRSLIKAGGYLNLDIQLFKNDRLFLSYEHGYLPGNYGNLVRNEMGTVQFIKTFNFR